MMGNKYTDPSCLSLAHFIVTRGEALYMKMLLEDNFMHADLHPGNILVSPCGGESVDADTAEAAVETDSVVGHTDTHHQHKEHRGRHTKIGAPEHVYSNKQNNRNNINNVKTVLGRANNELMLVDAGMVARLTKDQQTNFIGFLESLGEGNGLEAADYVLNFSATPIVDDSKRAAFRKDMQALFSRICKGYGNNVNAGEVLRGVLTLVRVHRVTVEANYATLIVNALCLDGLATSLLPSYNILDGAKLLLRANRRIKRLPLPDKILQGLRKFFMPLASWLKHRSDAKHLQYLQNIQKNDIAKLHEIYRSRKAAFEAL